MNELESDFYNQAINFGYTVLRRGWPDFLIVKDDEAQGVEVKCYDCPKFTFYGKTSKGVCDRE